MLEKEALATALSGKRQTLIAGRSLDGVAVELGAPVEDGAVLGEACGAALGGAGCHNAVLLSGHHGNCQALLDGAAAGFIAIELVGDGEEDLVCAMRGSGKNALGHGTFTPVGELVLANTHQVNWLGS